MNNNHQIFEKANMSKRLDIAEVALTLAILNGEPWAINSCLALKARPEVTLNQLRSKVILINQHQLKWKL